MNLNAAANTQLITPAMLAQAQALGSPQQVLALQQQFQMQQQTLGLAGASVSSQQAAAGAVAVQPKSSIGTILKSLVLTAGIGAAAGAGATFIPGVPGGPLMGAAIGAAAGALLGLVRGIRKARSEQDEQRALMLGSDNMPADPNMLGEQLPVEPAAEVAPAVAVAAAVAAPAAKKARPHHTIKAGDTLGKIAKMHHVTVAELQAANSKVIGGNPNMIHIGARLVIPAHHKK
ncbi:MAG: LysM peptidoglycan-binding domain-containing protein [Thermoleophilia bacterium]|nr:LysM peptidoglycan-binding domain-containing protein [Thermoleophilia bacterium]